MCDVRNPEWYCLVKGEHEVGEELEDELNTKGPGEAMFIACDVTQEEDIKVRTNHVTSEEEEMCLYC